MTPIIPIILKVLTLSHNLFFQDSKHRGKHLIIVVIFFLKIVIKKLELKGELAWAQVAWVPTTLQNYELSSFTTLGLNVCLCKTGKINITINLTRLLTRIK